MCGFSIVDWRFGRLVQEVWVLAAFDTHVHFEIRVQSGSNKHNHCLGMALTTIFSKLVHEIEFLCLEASESDPCSLSIHSSQGGRFIIMGNET